MNEKNLLSRMALLIGGIILVGAFFTFKGETPDNVFVLNLCVSLLIYALCFVDVLVPWVDWKENSHSRLGGIGMRWAATGTYAVLAIAAMWLCSHVVMVGFAVQLLIQGALLVLLLLGLSGMYHLTDKVAEVHARERNLIEGVQLMRRAMERLSDAVMECDGVNPDFQEQIDRMKENLRYLSPSYSREARELEEDFVRVAEEAALACKDFRMNESRIAEALRKAERICQNRKNIYSN